MASLRPPDFRAADPSRYKLLSALVALKMQKTVDFRIISLSKLQGPGGGFRDAASRDGLEPVLFGPVVAQEGHPAHRLLVLHAGGLGHAAGAVIATDAWAGWTRQ